MNGNVTNMCMIQDEKTGKVVVQHRTKNWCGLVFPGGHVEPDESLYDSVVREVKEETGLTVRHLKLCGIKNYRYNDVLYLVICYKTTCYTGELVQQSDEDKVEWKDLDELTVDNTPTGFLDMLKLFTTDAMECYFDSKTRENILIE